MTCLAQSWPALVTTAAPTAIGAIDIASRWMVGPPFRDRAADTPPPMIPSELAGLTTASTGIAVMSLFARCICMAGAAGARGKLTLFALQRAKNGRSGTRPRVPGEMPGLETRPRVPGEMPGLEPVCGFQIRITL